MKKRTIITRVTITLIGIIIISLLAITSTSYSETNKFYFEQVSKVKEEHNFEGFLKAHAVIYQEVANKEVDDYLFGVYHIVTREEQEIYNNNLLIFAVAKNDVKHATNKNDTSDKTQFIIGTLFDSKTSEGYQNFPLSFGYSEEQIGFIFITYKFSESFNDSFNYYDYDGNLITSIDVETTFIDYQENNDYENYITGYTTAEVSELIGLRSKIFKQAAIYNTIFLAIVIIGFATYDFIKKRN